MRNTTCLKSDDVDPDGADQVITGALAVPFVSAKRCYELFPAEAVSLSDDCIVAKAERDCGVRNSATS